MAFSRMVRASWPGTLSSCSTSSSCGYSSRSTKSRTVAAISRCSSVRLKSTVTARQPHDMAHIGGHRKHGMTSADLPQPASDLVRERAHLPRPGVDVQQHLLSGGYQAAG